MRRIIIPDTVFLPGTWTLETGLEPKRCGRPRLHHGTAQRRAVPQVQPRRLAWRTQRPSRRERTISLSSACQSATQRHPLESPSRRGLPAVGRTQQEGGRWRVREHTLRPQRKAHAVGLVPRHPHLRAPCLRRLGSPTTKPR